MEQHFSSNNANSALLTQQIWRTEPEISQDRRSFLTERLAIIPNFITGTFPFQGIKLTRADIEWLLTDLEHRNGGLSLRDNRPSLDLRGAILKSEDLSNLPLFRIVAGLTIEEWVVATTIQRDTARVHFEEATLTNAHLENAILTGAHFERATLINTHLEGAILRSAHLERSRLRGASLAGANFERTHLDAATNLEDVKMCDNTFGNIAVADVHWDGINVAVVDWTRLTRLGDEDRARNSYYSDGKKKDRSTRITEFEIAIRAYRQLATMLKNQGVIEIASRYTYRALVLQRFVYRLRRKGGRYLLSLALSTLSGYGYKINRIFAAYFFVISFFALIFYGLSLQGISPPTTVNQSFLISFTAFHGRVFDTHIIPTASLEAWFTAIEGVCGFVLEGIFIAMLVKRFFGSES